VSTQRHGNARGSRTRTHPPMSDPLPSPSFRSASPSQSPRPLNSTALQSSLLRVSPLSPPPGRRGPSRSRGRPRVAGGGLHDRWAPPTRPLSLVPVSVSRCPVPQPAISNLSAPLAFPCPRSRTPLPARFSDAAYRRYCLGVGLWEWDSSRRLSAQDADRPLMQLCYARRCQCCQQVLRATHSRLATFSSLEKL